MSVNRASYKLTVLDKPEGFDVEYFIFQMRKQVEDAKHHLNDDGKSSGADGDWRDMDDGLIPFSKKYPDVTFLIEAEVDYDGTYESRHYYRNGKTTTIEPVVMWPEFHPHLLE